MIKILLQPYQMPSPDKLIHVTQLKNSITLDFKQNYKLEMLLSYTKPQNQKRVKMLIQV